MRCGDCGLNCLVYKQEVTDKEEEESHDTCCTRLRLAIKIVYILTGGWVMFIVRLVVKHLISLLIAKLRSNKRQWIICLRCGNHKYTLS